MPTVIELAPELDLARPFTRKHPPDHMGITRVIGDLMQTLYPKRYKGELLDPVRARIGYLWEDALARTLPAWTHDFETTDDPFLLDGIAGYPDALYRWGTQDDACIVECKATYTSSKRALDDAHFIYYHMQGAGLAHMSGRTRACIFYVLFLAGDYTYPLAPKVKATRMIWSERELEDNWRAITNHAQTMRERAQARANANEEAIKSGETEAATASAGADAGASGSESRRSRRRARAGTKEEEGKARASPLRSRKRKRKRS